MTRFDEIRESRMRHKSAVEFIIGMIKNCSDYKSLESQIYMQLESAYVAGKMSNESWK